MNSIPTLAGRHLHTYNAIFQHPISHNLEWRAVQALLKNLGQIEEESNGHLKVTRNGHTLILHLAHTKDVAEPRDVMSLRHFLEQSEAIPPAMDDKNADWLLVIDHHQARIFRSEIRGSAPCKILPHQPGIYFHQERNSADSARGKEKPEPNTFFEPVAEALRGSGQIIVFGTGTGASSEMDQFILWLKTHHADLAKRIIGSLVVDEHHLTPDQLLGKARDFYAQAQPLAAGIA